MPLLAVPIVLLAVVLAIALIMPLSLVQRYRVGSSRRLARSWLVTLNLSAVLLSSALFFAGAAVTNVWVPRTLAYSLAGFVLGCGLGIIGLVSTRWEFTPRSLHYTPNALVVLAVTLVVTARVAYGLWRSWHVWRAGTRSASWLAVAGVAGSMAAGAVVLGYYVTYWAGVRYRLNQHRRGGSVIDVRRQHRRRRF